MSAPVSDRPLPPQITVRDLLKEVSLLTTPETRLHAIYDHRSRLAVTAVVVGSLCVTLLAADRMKMNITIGAPVLYGFSSPDVLCLGIAFTVGMTPLVGTVVYYQRKIRELERQKVSENSLDNLKHNIKLFAGILGPDLNVKQLFYKLKEDLTQSQLTNQQVLRRVQALEIQMLQEGKNKEGKNINFDEDALDLADPHAHGVRSISQSEKTKESTASWDLEGASIIQAEVIGGVLTTQDSGSQQGSEPSLVVVSIPSEQGEEGSVKSTAHSIVEEMGDAITNALAEARGDALSEGSQVTVLAVPAVENGPGEIIYPRDLDKLSPDNPES